MNLRPARTCLLTAFVGAAAALAVACGENHSPDAQVRSVIEAGEAAAEQRDLSALMKLVSSRYEDDEGRDRRELQHYVHAYLVANQSIHLLTRVDKVEFPYRDMARVELTLGSLGRDAGESFDVAADIEQLTLELQLDNGDWKVTRARRHGTG